MKYIEGKVTNSVVTVQTVWKNFVEFLDGACLAVVSGFAIYESLTNHGFKKIWAYGLLFAGVVIALQATVLLAKHFNKPVGK
jgi:uncharacterized membrane protein YraQ (UPF0718 family)